eukprot:GHRR01035096.1.p1 GENE.GHRR01035096.1~~GHRR01035096.1.p1  ORF type:complete len:153 (+),score=26.58 GHRR01035096.1:216-674(+)
MWRSLLISAQAWSVTCPPHRSSFCKPVNTAASNAAPLAVTAAPARSSSLKSPAMGSRRRKHASLIQRESKLRWVRHVCRRPSYKWQGQRRAVHLIKVIITSTCTCSYAILCHVQGKLTLQWQHPGRSAEALHRLQSTYASIRQLYNLPLLDP